ncbi:MAG TPA: SRPBCC family protein [Niastella sp.]|nr:SRPBCC family protein [Niastella sp.]
MVDVKTEIIINLPKEKVAEYVSDPGNAPSWCSHIKSVEWNQHVPLRAGARIIFNEPGMRRYQQYVCEIVEIIPNQKMVVKTRNNNMRMETVFAWQAINENTTCMTVWSRGIPRALSRMISPFMALAIRHTSRRNLKQLKRMLETSHRRMVVL